MRYAPHVVLAALLQSRNGRIILGAIVVILYIVTARIGLSIEPINTFATLVWMPSGIALAALMVGGCRFWPAVAIAAFAVNVSLGATIPAALGIAAGNTLEALTGAWVLERYVGFNPRFLRLRDSASLLGVAVLATTIAASIGVFSLWLFGTLAFAQLGTTWITWWIGDGLGILVVAPLLIKWLSPPYYQRNVWQYAELVLVVALSVGVCFVPLLIQPPHFAYFVFIPLGLAALRTGLRGTTLSIFTVSIVDIVMTLSDIGPFAGAPGGLFSLQIFLVILSGFFLIFASIVEELRRTKESLQEHIAVLEFDLNKVSSADEAKSEFLAILAHELRNPLAAVLSSVELLKLKDSGDTETAELLDTVDTRVRTMGRLLEDLLDISRVSQRHFKLDMQPVALDSAMGRIQQAFTPIMLTRQLQFTVQKPKQELYVLGDPVRIEQVIGNLLTNAAKYTPARGSITLTLASEDGRAELRVRDSGIGISRQMLLQIFQPFYQVERGKRKSDGLGIGLSLSKQLTELHGGSIEAKSEGEGKGSEFIVRLPLIEGRPGPVDRKTLPSNKTLRKTTHAQRILVVDDNEVLAEGMRRLLEMRGHDVHVAHTGTEALERADAVQPGVVLLDIGLPDIDGYQVASTLRKHFPTIILLALSGYGQREDKDKALHAGFDKHLTKPVGLREVEAALRSIKTH